MMGRIDLSGKTRMTIDDWEGKGRPNDAVIDLGSRGNPPKHPVYVGSKCDEDGIWWFRSIDGGMVPGLYTEDFEDLAP